MYRPNDRFAALRGLAFACAIALPATAFAQADAPAPVTQLSQDDVDEIIVTGSRIARPELTAMSPFAVIDEQAIALSNATNIEDFLRYSPQFAQALGSNTNNGNEGSATVDLRNLGEERTLVLVNGKRFVPYDYQGFVDVSMIPVSLIERVEVITGGASAVYGADAVAGVVNFILKDNFEGLEITGGTGITEEGDGEVYDLSVTAGGNFAGGRGNIVFNAGYTKQDAVSQADRRWSDPARDDFLDAFGSFNTPEGSTLYGDGNDAFEGCVQWDTDSNPIDCVNTFNFAPYNYFVVPQQKWTATALGEYEFSDKLEAFVRGSFANNRTDTSIAPSSTFGEPFLINTDNPLLTPAGAAIFQYTDSVEGGAQQNDGLANFLFYPRFVGLGARESEYENTAYQFVGGLRGTILEDQDWEAFAQYGRTSRNQNFFGDINKKRFQESLIVREDVDGLFCDSNNNGGRDALDNAACVPGNYFGVQPTTEMGRFIGLNLTETNKTDQLILGGSLSGDVGLSLPTAENPVGYAAGVEYRHEQGKATPDKLYAEGAGPGFGSSSPVDAEIEIMEVFGELLIPVLSGLPMAYSVNIETGIRYARYENTVNTVDGTTTNDFYNTSWKLGADWSPVEELRFNVMYQRAVRAPNMFEIALPKTPGTGDLSDDPCDNDFTGPSGDPNSDPDLVALCEATGVPAGLVGTFPSIIVGQIGNFSGGNPNLEPEEADTWTFGLDWSPSFLEGLSIGIDYYDIEIDDAITQLLEQDIVNACYFSEQNANGEFCSLIERSPLNGSLNAGSTVGVFRSYVNSAFETAEGVDFDIRYSFDTASAGTIDLGFVATYVIERESLPADFLAASDPQAYPYDCVGLVGEVCLRPGPELSFVQTTRWTVGPATLQLQWRWLDSITKDTVDFGQSSPADYAVPTIASQSYFDLTGAYDVNETWEVRGGITNLFDREPPVVGTFYGGTAENSGNTFPATYPAIGRSYYVSLTGRF
jgi:outer membrane receptor protein involved in Fe transport